MDTWEIKSVHLSTFPFSTKFVLCKYQNLHIPLSTVPNCEESAKPNYKKEIPASSHPTIDSDENELHTPTEISKHIKKEKKWAHLRNSGKNVDSDR